MERRTLSVGFADMSGYQKLWEVASEEEALALLQERLKGIGDAILGHGGQIRKYIGDAVLFTFEDRAAAASAAREIAGAPPREVNGLTIRNHVAVVTGEVLLTLVGHPSYLIEDILGPTVNRAAILLRQAAKSGSGLALCEETRREP